MKLDISETAEADLGEILTYSLENWGVVRAFEYMEDLDVKMAQLASGETTGARGDDIRSGMRRQISGSHIIWFRIEGDALKIIRVLHQRQDAGNWLG